MPVVRSCRAHGISNATFYRWRAKYGGMDALMIAQTKAMKGKNRQLKKMVAELVRGAMANAAQAAETGQTRCAGGAGGCHAPPRRVVPPPRALFGGSVMNSVYGIWPMRALATVTH